MHRCRLRLCCRIICFSIIITLAPATIDIAACSPIDSATCNRHERHASAPRAFHLTAVCFQLLIHTFHTNIPIFDLFLIMLVNFSCT